jgi:glutaredoxin
LTKRSREGHFHALATDDASRVTFKQLGRSVDREIIPYVFVDQRPVGGFADIRVLDRSGELERLVRSEI